MKYFSLKRDGYVGSNANNLHKRQSFKAQARPYSRKMLTIKFHRIIFFLDINKY